MFWKNKEESALFADKGLFLPPPPPPKRKFLIMMDLLKDAEAWDEKGETDICNKLLSLLSEKILEEISDAKTPPI